MAFTVHQTVVDPFGQALKGYREAVKDTYDQALKKVQMYNTLQRLNLAKSADARAQELHPLRVMQMENAIDTQDANNRYLPEHLRQRNAGDAIKLKNLQGEADQAQQQRLLDMRDADTMHKNSLDLQRARINSLNGKGGAGSAAPFTPRPKINITAPAAPPPPGMSIPGISVAPMKLGGPKADPWEADVEQEPGESTFEKNVFPENSKFDALIGKTKSMAGTVSKEADSVNKTYFPEEGDDDYSEYLNGGF